MDDAAAIRHHRCMSKLGVERAVLLGVLIASAAFGNGVEVRDFARAPAFAFPTLSPNGAHVSYVDQVEGRQVVFIRALERDEPMAILRVEPPQERVRWCGWADARYLLCGTMLTARKQHAIVERTKLYVLDATKREVRELNERSGEGARDQVIDLMPATPELVLLQQDVESRGFAEVVELNVANGRIRSVQRAHPPVRSWMSNGRGEIRLGIGYDDGVATLVVREPDSANWRPILTQSLFDPEALGPLAFGTTDTELYVLKHHRGRAALFRWDLAPPGSFALLLADPMFDIGGPLVLDPRTRELLAVRYQRESPTVHIFADDERVLQAWLDRELPDVVNEIVARSGDGSKLLVMSSSDTNPPSLYAVDRQKRRLELLGHQFPELEVHALAPMRPLMYAARDGQRIPAYLTRPASHTEPGPAIVLPHGGPEARDVRRFDPLVQFLAARGYAVLQMNFRGSLGYGAGFAAAGAQQWGGVMHNDITDGARWLVEQRIADPERMCIVGASFGGYAALLGAARESQWYACAASFGATSDLLAFAEFTRRLPDAPMWRERLGDDTRALWQMSPLAAASRIGTPLLLMHGRRDAVVPISQTRRLARALRNAGKAHEAIERSDCDHDMTAESCRIAVFDALDRFLSGVLARP